ncbi:hypothetical protein GMRT_11325 [Giardia muris]|uniref:Coiled-coil protein n=1 Tax=Giardia muris TaxID=5742 RepID=A0A4Z1SY67_GIAMU|nr:hypothetical protein GMRT_11325 [Giardia muris]|eukprot:TNJ26623.1 hypothetical protein GMRT_11325 [Giardia muris]
MDSRFDPARIINEARSEAYHDVLAAKDAYIADLEDRLDSLQADLDNLLIKHSFDLDSLQHQHSLALQDASLAEADWKRRALEAEQKLQLLLGESPTASRIVELKQQVVELTSKLTRTTVTKVDELLSELDARDALLRQALEEQEKTAALLTQHEKDLQRYREILRKLQEAPREQAPPRIRRVQRVLKPPGP